VWNSGLIQGLSGLKKTGLSVCGQAVVQLTRNSKAGSSPGKDADNIVGLAHLLEMDHAIDPGKERVVAADADIGPGAEPGSALADEYASRRDNLSAEALHAETLRIAIASVS